MPISELSFLAVEDHEFQRRMVLRILRGLGATRVCVAADGAAALAIVKAQDPQIDIIISDLDMPGMDGVEFIRHLSEAGLPVAMILASALDGMLLASVETMARDYGIKILGAIEKPVTPAKLKALIELHQPAPPNPNANPDTNTNSRPPHPASATKTAGPPLSRKVIVEGLKKTLGQWRKIAQPAAPIDRAILATISGGDAAAELEILTDFRRVNDDDAALLKLAVGRRDISQVTHTSDRIKGASMTVGAHALAAVCERMERAGGIGDWKAIDANLGAFQRELERLNSYCEQAKYTSPGERPGG